MPEFANTRHLIGGDQEVHLMSEWRLSVLEYCTVCATENLWISDFHVIWPLCILGCSHNLFWWHSASTGTCFTDTYTKHIPQYQRHRATIYLCEIIGLSINSGHSVCLTRNHGFCLVPARQQDKSSRPQQKSSLGENKLIAYLSTDSDKQGSLNTWKSPAL